METYEGELKRRTDLSKNLFQQEQWDKLEELMNNTRKEKKRNSFGTPQLASFYQGMSILNFSTSEEPDAKWLDYKNKLEKWEKAKPDSITVQCSKINFWIHYAWKAHGDGRVNKVTEEGKKLYSERLKKAEEIYTAIEKKYAKKIVSCPQFYTESLIMSLSLGWNTEKCYEDLMEPVIKNWPLYYVAYIEYARRLQPQWGGNAGDDYELYNSLKDVLGGELGKEVSAHCIFQYYGGSLNNFRYDLVDTEEILEGLVYHVRRNPNDADLIKRVITFSTRYDLDTTQKLINDLRDTTPVTYKQFEEKFSYGSAIKAMRETPEKSIEKNYYIRPDSSLYVRPIRSVSTQDGVDHYVYAQGWDCMAVVRNSDCKILAIERTIRRDPICYETVALSKSGDHIFVEIRNKGKRIFRIYTFKDNQLELIKSIDGPLGFTEHAEFVEDDKTILLAGEKKGSNYKTSLYYRWNWQNEDPQYIGEAPRGDRTKMAILEDKKQVVCYSGKDALYYNYTEEKPEVHKLKLNIAEEDPFIYHMHYAKEINALAVVTQKDNCLALLDPENFEVKLVKKIGAKPSFATLVDGYKHGENDYTFCLSGQIGQISVYHYNKGQKEPIKYESTIVNADYHASHISVIEKKDEAPRIIQAYYSGGILGSYTAKEE